MFPRTLRRALATGAALVTVATALVALESGLTPASAASHGRLRHDGDRATYLVSGQGRVRITARAAYCKGFPIMRVWIDGRLDRTVRTTRRTSRVYLSTKSYAAGKHRVTVILRRDKKVTKRGKVVCNRGIHVTAVRIPPAPVDPVVRSVPYPTPVPGDADGAFAIAILGDTQNEVLRRNDASNPSRVRAEWLARNWRSQDLRLLLQTGDLVNWGWLAPEQFEVAKTAMETITSAGLAVQGSIGNHDSRAVRIGGKDYRSVCLADGGSSADCSSNTLLRRTPEYNAAFPAEGDADLAGEFETGKVDNTYASFSAAGRTWLVLNLELWPRSAVLDWAGRVIASHPDSNVIIQTHDYLTRTGGIAGNGGYGNEPATAIKSRLVDPYPNVKLVFSGHEALAGTKAFDDGGHRVAAYVGNESNNVAVTRLVTIDVVRGTVTTTWWRDTADLTRPASGTDRVTGFSFR